MKISEKSFHNFLSYLADTQTNRVWQKHNLLGGGNNLQLSINQSINQSSIIQTSKVHRTTQLQMYNKK